MARKIKNSFTGVVTDTTTAGGFMDEFIRTTNGVTTSNFNSQGFTSYSNVRDLAFDGNEVRPDGVQALLRMGTVIANVLAEVSASNNQAGTDALLVLRDCIDEFPETVADQVKRANMAKIAATVGTLSAEDRAGLIALLAGQ